jgi:hypothetical protein
MCGIDAVSREPILQSAAVFHVPDIENQQASFRKF